MDVEEITKRIKKAIRSGKEGFRAFSAETSNDYQTLDSKSRRRFGQTRLLRNDTDVNCFLVREMKTGQTLNETENAGCSSIYAQLRIIRSMRQIPKQFWSIIAMRLNQYTMNYSPSLMVGLINCTATAFRVQGFRLGFGVQGLGFQGFRIGFGVQGVLGLQVRVQGVLGFQVREFRVQGFFFSLRFSL